MKDAVRDAAQEGTKGALGVDQPIKGRIEMMDGARMMWDAKRKILGDPAKKGLIRAGMRSEGEAMMNDGEKMMKEEEMMMLK